MCRRIVVLLATLSLLACSTPKKDGVATTKNTPLPPQSAASPMQPAQQPPPLIGRPPASPPSVNEAPEQINVDALIEQAKKGEPSAELNLAVAYYDGRGIQQDYKEAFTWYSRAAKHSVPEALFAVGVMHEYGQGVPVNLPLAVKYYEQAAQLNYPEAITNLGLLYNKGKGVTQDFKKARSLYERAADLGEKLAQYNLANMFREGVGGPKNIEESRKWYLKAAEQNHRGSMYNLGLMYFEGPTLRSSKDGIFWYSQASNLGFGPASSNLGRVYHYGDGVPADYQKARQLYLLALEQGNVSVASNQLGVMYTNGEGVPRDLIMAYAYFSVANAYGVPEAKNNLQIIEGRMSQSQVRTAQETAASIYRKFKQVDFGIGPLTGTSK